MDTRMMEVLAFVDGIDAMTSKQLQARRAYSPAEMRLCEQFVAMHLEVRGGRLGLDFTHFDDTVAATGARCWWWWWWLGVCLLGRGCVVQSWR
jgi:hypothetical protein